MKSRFDLFPGARTSGPEAGGGGQDDEDKGLSKQGPSTLQQQCRRLAALAEVELLGYPDDIESTLIRIAKAAERLLPTSAGAGVILWDERVESFTMAVSTVPGQSPEVVLDRVRPRSGVTRWIVVHRQPFVVPDVCRDPFGANSILHEFGIQAYAGFPLLAGKEVLGVLYVLDYQPRDYSKADQAFLALLAGRAAITILNARLFSQVQRLATTDELTGLCNRRHFFVLAEQEFRRARRLGQPLAAMMLDVDHFRRVNETYGYVIGDQVLRGIAALCQKNSRAIDILGRYGGEEFAILLPAANLQSARQVAERLRHQVESNRLSTDAGLLSVTISLGVAALDEQTPTLLDLLNQADAALHVAKRSGRNRVEITETTGVEL